MLSVNNKSLKGGEVKGGEVALHRDLALQPRCATDVKSKLSKSLDIKFYKTEALDHVSYNICLNSSVILDL